MDLVDGIVDVFEGFTCLTQNDNGAMKQLVSSHLVGVFKKLISGEASDLQAKCLNRVGREKELVFDRLGAVGHVRE